MVELYFEDSGSKMAQLESRLQEPAVDFAQVDQLVHQFKGSSSSFGAHQMAGVCVRLREAGHAQDAGTCRQLSAELQHSFVLLKARLEQFMLLETQRKQLARGGG
jgi:histidine-containing phosphotransfer protein